MRKILMICAAASVFAACNGNKDSDLETKKDVVVTDTSGMYKSNVSTDTGTARVITPTPAPPVAAPTKTIIRERTVYVDRTPKKQQNVTKATPTQPVGVAPQTTTTTTSTTTTAPNTGNAPATSTGTNTAGTGTATPSTTTPAKNKGWSNAAKDATIGGVGGAIGGAVISKNKGKGAIIGGVIGAAGGYILGRKKDKKDTIK